MGRHAMSGETLRTALLCALLAPALSLSSCKGGGGGGGDGLPPPPGGPNSPPSAVASSDRSAGELPLQVAFSAGGSTDREGSLRFDWDFGDGSAAGSGLDVVHTFDSAGDFTVVLTVTDSAGAASEDRISVSVAPLSCPDFDPGVNAGAVESAAVIEASGIAASRRNPGVLWIDNDSGDSARIFAAGTAGRHLGVYDLPGAAAYDWEDIAVGPGPDPDLSYIYIADIGDNAYARSQVSVYRVAEPAVDPEQAPVAADLAGAVRLDMSYPGGPNDAESLMVDPETADIYIVTKRGDGNSMVLRNPAPHTPGSPVVMEAVAELHFGSGSLPGSPLATGADISSRGCHILIRTYSSAFIWLRPPGTSIGEALAGPPCPVPLCSEPQGEAIGFSADGSSYFTVSEGGHQPLYRFDRAAAP